MDLMEQIERWNQEDRHQKIIDAIEALPETGQTPELVSALARAYNNLAQPGDTALLERAVSLLKSVEEELHDEHSWNFRIAYAYYYLDQEGPALRYFERALELRPGDADTQELIDDCRSRLALPLFEKPFRARVREGWASFLSGEAALRDMIRERQDGERLMERCAKLLAPAFADLSFELGFNGEKCELILTPEGDEAKLFKLAYFQRRAPAQVLEHWNIHVGRQPSRGFGLRMFGRELSAADVQVWIDGPKDGRVSLAFYSEALLPLLEENEGQAYWILSILLDQTIGEIAAMRLLDGITLQKAPGEGAPVPMDRLAEALEQRGLETKPDIDRILERYCAYEAQPRQDEDADLRMDVFAGMTRCVPLLRGYLENDGGLMDDFHRDGAVPGFLYYPLEGFDGEERGKRVLDFRDSVEAAILKMAGEDAVTFLGGASGVYYGYLDLIAWDLEAVLDAAVEAFRQSAVGWAGFHTFRRDIGGISLKEEDPAGAGESL